MRLFLLGTVFTALLMCQDAKVEPKAKVTPKAVPTITDKDRADFLLVQRDWLTVQKRYEDAFKKEPITGTYESKGTALNKICQDGGGTFNPQTVLCDMPIETKK